MIATITLALLMGQDPSGQLKSVIGHRTGKNGYEEYVQAAIELTTPAFEEAYRKVLKNPPGSAEYLYSRLSAASAGLKAKSLVLQGNAKDVFYPHKMDAGTLFPELSNFRMVSRYLAVQTAKEFSDGRNNDAGDTILAHLVFSEKVSNSGLLINYLVGLGSLGTALASVSDHLEVVSLSSWEKIIKHCDETLAARPMLEVMRREMGFTLSALDEFFADPKVQSFFDADEMEPEEKDMADRLSATTPQQRAALKQSIRALAEARYAKVKQTLSGDESAWIAGLRQMDNEPTKDTDPLARYLYETLTPVYEQAVQVSLRSRAQLRVLRLHGLIQSHRWETGSLPDTLSAVGRADALVDPLSGEPFQYDRLGDSYELYSKGNSTLGRVGLVYRRPQGASDEVTPP